MIDYSKLSSAQLRELLFDLYDQRAQLDSLDAELKAQIMPVKDELDSRARGLEAAKRQSRKP